MTAPDAPKPYCATCLGLPGGYSPDCPNRGTAPNHGVAPDAPKPGPPCPQHGETCPAMKSIRDSLAAEASKPGPPETVCRTCGQTGRNGLVGLGDSNEPLAPCPTCTVRNASGEMMSRHWRPDAPKPYGHAARKRTWIYYVGAPIEGLWDRPAGTHQIGWFDRIKPTLSKREASSTPVAFAEWLIALAQQSETPEAEKEKA